MTCKSLEYYQSIAKRAAICFVERGRIGGRGRDATTICLSGARWVPLDPFKFHELLTDFQVRRIS